MSVDAVLAGAARWHVEQGNCMPWLATLPDRCVAHVITDPPYDERTHAGARCGTGDKMGVSFAALTDPASLAQELLRVASRWVIAFGTIEAMGKYQAGAGVEWVRAGVWDRVNPSPQLTGDRPATAVDAIAIMHRRGRKRWNRGGGAAIWRFASPRGADRPEHPTPKPIDLMLALIEDFTDPGDIVLDPFAGSGTTGVAALRLGRRFIGCELDPKYHALACERLTAEERGTTLHAQRAGQATLFDRVKVPA